MTVRAALVPGAPVLLPTYAGQVDPVAELRHACRAAVDALVSAGPSRVLVVAAPVRAEDAARGVAASVGARVGRHLLDEAGHTGDVVDSPAGRAGAGDAVLLVGNGTACRSERAPGHLDERAFGLDSELERTVRDGAAPPHDDALAEQLWCFDLPVFRRLHELVDGVGHVEYADDVYGVAYWVATWSCLRGESSR